MRDGGYNMTENCISMESVEEFHEEYARLRLLVWELLRKNEQLRTQLSGEEESLQELHFL